MLEDMRADYDNTQAAFGMIVKAALAEMDCGEHLKDKLRDAGRIVYQTEWAAVRYFGLDRAFLTWLCSDTKPWLYTKEPVWWFLPATGVEGLDYLLTSDDADERKRGKRMDKARTERVERAVAALKDGWCHEDAVALVKSREEWEAAMNGVDLKMDGTPRWSE
jgi:hypothetical protein